MAFRGRHLATFIFLIFLVLSFRDADGRRGGSRSRFSRSSSTRRRVSTGTNSTTDLGMAGWVIALIIVGIVVSICLIIVCAIAVISVCKKSPEHNSEIAEAYRQIELNNHQKHDAPDDEAAVTAEPSETAPPPSYEDALNVPTAPDGQNFAST